MIKGKGGHKVYIDDEMLLPNDSLKLYNHSPTGFSWGYAGSGPSQLALALLLHFTNKEFALKNYQNFKFEVIAKLPQASFSMPTSRLKQWLKDNGWPL